MVRASNAVIGPADKLLCKDVNGLNLSWEIANRSMSCAAVDMASMLRLMFGVSSTKMASPQDGMRRRIQLNL